MTVQIRLPGTLTALPSASFVASGLTANAPTTHAYGESDKVQQQCLQHELPGDTPTRDADDDLVADFTPTADQQASTPTKAATATAPTIQRAASIGFIELARERSGAICFSCSISVGEVSSWFAAALPS